MSRGKELSGTITSEVVVAYSHCPRKAFLLLCAQERGSSHEYTRLLDERKRANEREYLKVLNQVNSDFQSYDVNNLDKGEDLLIKATLKFEEFEADCGILTKVRATSSLGEYSYEPTIFMGTYSMRQEQKIELVFVGYVLGNIQGKLPVSGRVIGLDEKTYRVSLENSIKILKPLLEPLQEWLQESPPEPPVVLNKHCPYCQFQDACTAKAEQEDNLSLLDRFTPKIIRQYESRGIFTVKQLSYLFKPRKRKKHARKIAITHKPELQALAIRTGKIYLQELPDLSRQPVELFLDIEGIPDQQAYYLIGLLICDADKSTYDFFWADTLQEEPIIWQQFLERVNQYPDAPIYHYGSYESRALSVLARRYRDDIDNIKNRLVNINTYIYGRIYFPVKSNRLKEIGKFIGANWTSPNASGLQALVWREYWDRTRGIEYYNWLLIYNKEDCRALELLTNELSKIKTPANILSEIDFVDQPKKYLTENAEQVHSQFEIILEFAHAHYDKKKIRFRQNREEENDSNIIEKVGA